MNETKVNQLENYLRKLIIEEVKNQNEEIRKSDAEKIVSEIIIELNELVAKEVKKHFTSIASFIIDKFSEVKK